MKGDHTSLGTLEEYSAFQEFYVPAFGDKLTYVRGNHDSFPGLAFANGEIQVVDVPGLRVILLDTSPEFASGGSASSNKLTP